MNLLIENYPLLREAVEAIMENRTYPGYKYRKHHNNYEFYVYNKLFDFEKFFSDMCLTHEEQRRMFDALLNDISVYEKTSADMKESDPCRKYEKEGNEGVST